MISIAEKVENHVLAHSGWSLINLELFVILLSLKFKPILIYFAGTETLKITRLLCQWLPVTLSLEGSKGKREDRKREKPLPSICSFLLVPASLTPAMLFSLCSSSLFPCLQLMIPVFSTSNTHKNSTTIS